MEHKPSYPKKAPIHLSYELSPEQKELSDKLVENYKKGIDSLVFAVCGSGKTEISLQIIQYAINCGEKVAFAVPRKDVVIELHNRLKEIFAENTVISLYGGHTDVREADLIVLTTHQLFRYVKYFSLIIMDEIDAFPFKDNEVLNQMFFNSLCGHYVMMSATPSDDVIEHFKSENKDILSLNVRFHRHPLPVPIFVIKSNFLFIYLIKLVRRFLKEKKPLFIFAPTIEECEKVYFLLHLFFLGGNYVHSKRNNREKIIDNFRKNRYTYLVTTSVLERGVTVKDLQVIIYKSDNRIYDKGTLIQIAGRVGRKLDAPEGEVYFLAARLTEEMTKAKENIIESNKGINNESKS